MLKRVLGIIGLVLIVIGQSCYYDNEEELYPDDNCDTSNVTFSGTVNPIIQTNCAITGCHVPGTGRVVLQTPQQIKVIVDDGRLEQRAVQDKDMPPTGPLNNCEITQIQTWLNAGAPNN
ncbi:hypothetical protein QQ008_08400 [Fulvivirgaceae bacterium BMA10]|uniref:Cytochrome c domain-containing protein n=1 Tax=Splendidivirga corallicola TaxID=3051826 RepID=A0ABT8KKY7_9BACT|nr:hypothetical protein [Fulvivirgaceae bacterium BMA10]